MKDDQLNTDVSRRRWLTGSLAMAAAGGMTDCSPGTDDAHAQDIKDLGQGESTKDTDIRAAVDVVNQGNAAFNARDQRARRKLFHFPNVRVVSRTGAVEIETSPEDTPPSWKEQGITLDNYFEKLAERLPGWHRSALDQVKVLYSRGEVVVVQTNVTRYSEEGSKINSSENIRIVTNENGRWGVKVRFSGSLTDVLEGK